MSLLLDQNSLATSGDFQSRVRMAALTVAAGKLGAVAAEAQLARAVIRNPDEIVIRLARACVIDVTVAGAPPTPAPAPEPWTAADDAALVARITALWQPFAAATAV